MPSRRHAVGLLLRWRKHHVLWAFALCVSLVMFLLLGERWLERESAPAIPSIAGGGGRVASVSQRSSRNLSARSASVAVPARALTGTVRSAGGTVPRATVCTVARQNPKESPPLCVSTDDRGHFELHGFDPEAVEAIVASAPAHLPGKYALGEGDQGGRENPSPVTIILEPGGVDVVGRALDATGGPVPFALVTIRSSFARNVHALVHADSNGEFVAPAPEGVVDVVAQAEGYSQAARRVLAPARGITLMLAPGAEIVGRVVDAETEGPIAGVTVIASPSSGEVETRNAATSDGDGAFRVVGLSGLASYEVAAVSSAWRSDAVAVRLNVGQPSEPVVLRASRATTLSGTVSMAGQPCGEALVMASGRVSSFAYADAKGNVRLDGLLPGRYQVLVQCPMALAHEEEVEVAGEPLTREWAVDPGVSISGRVESANGQPVSAAVVSVSLVDGLTGEGVSCTADANGHFTCSGLRPGVYDCSIEQDRDPNRQVVRVSLDERGAEPVLLRVRPSGTIRVSVANGGLDRWPLRVLARGEARIPIEAVVGQDGFVFRSIPLGEYEIYSDRGGASQNARVEHDQQVVELELDVPRDVLSIQGQAMDEAGFPIVDAWVSASRLDSPPTSLADEATALTDEQGNFTVHDLPRGTYVLQVRAATGVGEARAIVAGSSGVVVLVRTQT